MYWTTPGNSLPGNASKARLSAENVVLTATPSPDAEVRYSFHIAADWCSFQCQQETQMLCRTSSCSSLVLSLLPPSMAVGVPGIMRPGTEVLWANSRITSTVLLA